MRNLKNPSGLMRPAPFWSWNDKLDERELRRQIREMAAKGWGGYFMHSRVGLVTGYLSREWMDMINACADEAEKTGTYAWLYDEDKWPSGFAGGIVPEKDESYRSRSLVLIKKGKSTKNDTVLATINYSGVDYEICKRVSPLGSTWFNGACYVDLMNPEAVREFINSTHERYKTSCGRYFGKSIPGIFTDEPCYLMQNEFNAPSVPWSDFLPGFFKKLKGYDIMNKLPHLFFEMEGYRKARLDFYDAAAELFKRSFTKQYYDWCEKNSLIMTGHFMAEDSLWYQTQWSGDVMSHYEFMHWPGIDKLGRHLEQIVTVKQVNSAVEQLGKERAFCEVFGCVGGQVNFFHRKWIGDWQAALGINFVNHHLSLYSMRGERKRDFPANLFYQQPWWEDEKGFADYEARLCAVVSEGKQMVDVLLLQPLSSVWCEYSPLHQESNYAAEKVYDEPFLKISRRLLEEKIDFHYGNENLMAKFGSVQDGKLKIGRCSYTCVIIPPSSNLKRTTVSLLKNYVKNGGRLLIVRQKPNLVDGEEKRIDLQGAITTTSIEEAVKMAIKLFPKRLKVIDRLTEGNAATVYVHRRKVRNSIRYLLVNTDEKREVKATVKLHGNSTQKMAIFDLYDGELYRFKTRDGDFDTTLYPAGSLVILCGDEAVDAKKRLPAFLGSGAAFKDFTRDEMVMLIEDFDCHVLEENVLLLNDFILEMKGKKVYEGPVCGAWHKHFYPAPEGTHFKATYTFYSEVDVKGCFADIELAENLDKIIFNGREVKALKKPGELGAFDTSKNWKDINWTRVPLPNVKKGLNSLVIEGRKVNNITGIGRHRRLENWNKHYATEAEEVYILGKFSLKRFSEGRYIIAPFKKPKGKNLTYEGFPFYCGRVIYKASFKLTQKSKSKTFIKLNGVEAACASVKVNDKNCGTLRWAPFVLDISDSVRRGNNELKVELVTTLVNAFGPNRRAGIKEETGVYPESFMQMERFKEGYELFDFGIESAAIYNLKKMKK